MGPGGVKTNPQQGPGTPYWTQPSQADRPAVEAIGGATVEPVFPAPSGAQSAEQPQEQK